MPWPPRADTSIAPLASHSTSCAGATSPTSRRCSRGSGWSSVIPSRRRRPIAGSRTSGRATIRVSLALYFHFGRYLLISSSRPGGQPANLQGIWNQELLPAWGSKWTTNINLEMNYWLADAGNLWETQEPLWSLVRDLRVTGADTARVHYGAQRMGAAPQHRPLARDDAGGRAHGDSGRWARCGSRTRCGTTTSSARTASSSRARRIRR